MILSFYFTLTKVPFINRSVTILDSGFGVTSINICKNHIITGTTGPIIPASTPFEFTNGKNIPHRAVAKNGAPEILKKNAQQRPQTLTLENFLTVKKFLTSEKF